VGNACNKWALVKRGGSGFFVMHRNIEEGCGRRLAASGTKCLSNGYFSGEECFREKIPLKNELHTITLFGEKRSFSSSSSGHKREELERFAPGRKKRIARTTGYPGRRGTLVSQRVGLLRIALPVRGKKNKKQEPYHCGRALHKGESGELQEGDEKTRIPVAGTGSIHLR